MDSNAKDNPATPITAGQLLGRGSRALGLAALAHGRGQRPGAGPWHVLGKEMVGAVEEVLLSLEKGPEPKQLEAAIRATMAPRPATASPRWAEPLWRDPTALKTLGAALETVSLTPALGPRFKDPSDVEKGLAGLAIAFSRSLDSLGALADNLTELDRNKAVRMGYLAQTLVGPREPSKMRAFIKQFVTKELSRG